MTNSKTDQKKIWDFFQSKSQDTFHPAMPRYDFLIKQVKKYKKQNSKILNIGIGLGIIEEKLSQLLFDVFSLDPSEIAVAGLIKKGIKAKTGLIENQPFESNFFDLVLISEVIEHIPKVNLNKSVSEIYRVLKKDGILLVTVPFNENLNDNVTICPECGHNFHRWGHHNSFTHKNILELFTNRFEIIKIKTVSFPNWTMSIKGLIKGIAKYILGRFGASITTPRIYLVAKKI